MHASTSPWIGLAGPTASGKSAVALALAKHMPIELISVDSALVYRGMDIGTAKPSAAEQALVPHHLIDIIEPHQTHSAADFVKAASVLIEAITARRHVPLLVGGTMLYYRALMLGLDDMPPADAGVRARLEAQAAERGWPAMHAELAKVDAETATRLAPNDSQRIQRALEVWHLSGRTLSSWHTRKANESSGLPRHALISLEPSARTWLHQRIEARFDAMLNAGFMEEVKALMKRSNLHPDLPSMRCVGYRQAWSALAEGRSMTVMRGDAIAATRQLAKRQLTWLRSMPKRSVVACDQDNDTVFGEVLGAVQQRWAAINPAA